MARALVCTVGGQSRPVLNAIEQNGSLDRIYFLCSTGTGESGSDVVIERTTTAKKRGSCPHCKKDFTVTTKVPPIAQWLDEAQEACG